MKHGDMRIHIKLCENLKVGGPLGNLDVEGRVIFECNLRT